MSVKVMGWVFDLPIPSREKFVLLAYADHADHDGKNVFPAIETVAKKTGYNERTVQRATRQLEKIKLLVPDGKGPNGTNRWRIDIKWRVTDSHPVPESPRTRVTKGVTDSHIGGVPQTPEPSLTVNEPSFTPQQIMVGILAEVTGLDFKLKSNAGRLAKRGTELLRAGYLPEQVQANYSDGGWWYLNDWRGQKDQKPTPEQIIQTIKQAIEESEPRQQSGEIRTIQLPSGELVEASL